MRHTPTILIAALLTAAIGCAQTSHDTKKSEIGTAPSWAEVEASIDQPGPIEFERIIAADWSVPRSGLINLDAEAATKAGLEDGPEPIQIYMYALRHPDHGLFLIDTGVDRATATGDKKAMAASGLVRGAMNLEALTVHVDTKTWIGEQPEPLAGVFLTHLHLDHSMGLPDVPDDVPVYTGPGEVADKRFMTMFSRGTTNRTLSGKGPLQELQTKPVEGSEFAGVLDVFGDQSLIAIHIPGHTTGSLAFLVKTTEGPVLLTGDGSHTAWGWDHHVEPGTYNTDGERAAKSLDALIAFAARYPAMRVHLGHQTHARNGADENAEVAER